MEAQRYPEACRKFEESYRFERSAGTLLNMAECHQKEGKIATSWGDFTQALLEARRSGRADREKVAQARIEELTPLVPYITIEVPAASRVPELKIMRNGTPFQEGGWNSELPIDPGPAVIEARAPGYKPWKKEIAIELKAKARVQIPALEALPAPAPVPVPSSSSSASAAPAPERSGTQRTVGLILGGVGVVGLGVGSYFGLRAKSQKNDSDARCPSVDGQLQCTAEGASLYSDAKGNATRSTVTFGVGAAALITGAVLYFTAPSGNKTEHTRQSGSISRPVNFDIGFGDNSGYAVVTGGF